MNERMRLQRKLEKATALSSLQALSVHDSPFASRQYTDEVPSIVHEVLSSEGQHLDAETRAYMEPRFGHDFSKIRVHTDERAVESAQAVNALAYTVGRDVVFGQGQYLPETSGGKKLIAHELTHTIQQTHHKLFAGSMKTSEPADVTEKEAEYVADAIMNGQPFAVTSETAGEIARQDDSGTSTSVANAPGGVAADPNATTNNEDSIETSALLEEVDDEASAGEGGDDNGIGHAILEGGAGLGYGALQAITPGGFLAPSPAPQSRRFEFFRSAGQIATGIAELVAGGAGEALGIGLDATGVGAPAGIALNIGSAVVLANAATNVVAGVQALTHAMSMGGGGGGGGGRLPKKGTPERAALEAARRRGIRGAQARELDNIRAGGKGSGVWTDAELDQIRSTGEFPKDVRWHHEPTVANRPDLADDPTVVRPVRGGVPGHLAAHGGDFRK